MAAQNPFAADQVLGDAWEQGYLAGYSEPETDHLRPFSPELLDAYQQGELAGRDDRRLLPADTGGEGADESQLAVVALEVGLHTLGHIVFEKAFGAIGGLGALLITVLQIPGDVMLQPVEPDWTGPADEPDDVYVAVCPRDDHGPVQGGTPEGYWSGQGHPSYAAALADMKAHRHAEAAVARCSVPNGECGLVWPGTGQ